MNPTFNGRSFLDINDFSNEEILFLFAEAKALASKGKSVPVPQGKSVVHLFFEPSTRTKSSFEMAAFRLGLKVINLDPGGSSAQKGETIYDTAQNIEMLEPDAIVVRHSGSGIPMQIAKIIKIPVINAGDGFHAHPTQALLDAFTMHKHFQSINGLRVLIVGDIAHSRVARSNISLLKRFGARVEVCGPPTLIPPFATELGIEVTDKLDQAIGKADVVMALRMQVERQASFQVPSLKEYSSRFGISVERLSKMKKTAIVMHPGPVNRGVEMSSEVFSSPQSKILDQVHNGVLMRTILLREILGLSR